MKEFAEAEKKPKSPEKDRKQVKKESPVKQEKSPKKSSFRETTSESTTIEEISPQTKGKTTKTNGDGGPPALMWVDKYMPSSTKQIIGQQVRQSILFKYSLSKLSAGFVIRIIYDQSI